MVSLTVQGADVTIRWTSGTQSTQVLERTDSLAEGRIWTTVQTFNPSNSLNRQYTDSGGALRAGFYRVQFIPAGP